MEIANGEFKRHKIKIGYVDKPLIMDTEYGRIKIMPKNVIIWHDDKVVTIMPAERAKDYIITGGSNGKSGQAEKDS